MKLPKCKTCGKPGHYTHKCFLNQKPINKIGKETIKYNQWRDTVAKPYLDMAYGHYCVSCGTSEGLEVDHIETRGGHYEKKYDLSNVQYLCHYPCHYNKTNHL